MKYLCQRDPRWAGTTIANAPFTVGSKGCAFTALIELWQSLYKKQITAKQYIALVTNPKLFTDKKHPGGPGLILWERVCAELNKTFGTDIVFEGREDGDKRANQIRALKDPDRGCLLQVNNGAHFVTLWREAKAPSKDLIVADPWYGDLEYVKKVYHNITGARYFRKAKV